MKTAAWLTMHGGILGEWRVERDKSENKKIIQDNCNNSVISSLFYDYWLKHDYAR